MYIIYIIIITLVYQFFTHVRASMSPLNPASPSK